MGSHVHFSFGRPCLLAISTLTFCARSRFFFVRFQGRRNCNFTTDNGPTSCLDGGCNGGLQCDPHSGTVRPFPAILTYTQLTHPPFPFHSSPHSFPVGMQGTPPATVAEWTLQGNGSNDFYDGARVAFYLYPPSLRNSENIRTEREFGCVCSVRCGWVQYPDDDHSFRQLFHRFVPRRP